MEKNPSNIFFLSAFLWLLTSLFYKADMASNRKSICVSHTECLINRNEKRNWQVNYGPLRCADGALNIC